MSALSAFCTQLVNLLNNLHDLYPNDNDISMSITTINLLKSANPRQLLNVFRTYVLKYEENLLKEDENFFLQTDFLKDPSVDEEDKTNYAETIMNNLKKYWKELDDESKQNIWKYFKVLIVLSKKC